MPLIPKKIPGLWKTASNASWRGSVPLWDLFKDCPKCLVNADSWVKIDKLGIRGSKLGFWRTKRLISQAARYDNITLPQVRKQITKVINNFLDTKEAAINTFYLAAKQLATQKTQVEAVLAFAKKHGFKKATARCENLLEEVGRLEENGLPWEGGKITVTNPDVQAYPCPDGVTYVAGSSRFHPVEADALFDVPLQGVNAYRYPDFEGPWHYQRQRMSILESLGAWAESHGPLQVKFERNPKYPSHVQIILVADTEEIQFIDFSIRKAVAQIQTQRGLTL